MSTKKEKEKKTTKKTTVQNMYACVCVNKERQRKGNVYTINYDKEHIRGCCCCCFF